MMTPFELVDAQKVVKKIVCTHKKGVIRNINKYFRKRFWKILFNKGKITIGIKDACTIWVYACIFEDIAYNHDYSRYCSCKSKDYADRYIKAREKIKEEFDRKKGFSRKYKILDNIVCGLNEVAAIPSNVDSEMMKRMNRVSRADGNALRKTLLSLMENLSRWQNTFNK